MRNYPKILIVNGYSFNDVNGGGITLKNLFRSWPLNKIAMAHWDDPKPVPELCEKYYKLGYNECHFVFPFNKLSATSVSATDGPYLAEHYAGKSGDGVVSAPPSSTDHYAAGLFKRWFLAFIDSTGLDEFLHPMRISREFRAWVKDFNPDIIYTQCGNLAFTELALQLQKETGSKIVVHTMDDWPSSIYRNRKLSFLLRWRTINRFKQLLDISAARFCISAAMADEYRHRYKLPFSYYHNPIDTRAYLKEANTSKKHQESSFRLTYAGRLGIASYYSLAEVSRCISTMRAEGTDIEFRIYSDLKRQGVDFSVFHNNGTLLFPSLNDNTFITTLSEADLLLFPVDFDEESKRYIRLSFPTKLPSYFVSGTPVFGYGPETIHSIQMIRDNKLGFVCSSQDTILLQSAIMNAIQRKGERDHLAQNAFRYAAEHFDTEKVRNRFHEEIIATL